MGRGKAWFSEADFQLAQAWVQASQDPIIGTNQDGKSFWQTIKSNFMKLSKTNEERSISSLQSQWSDINKKATKFNGTYLQIKRVPRSGFNEDKYIEEALKLYKEEMSEDFPFLSIWHYLKDKPKWTDYTGPDFYNVLTFAWPQATTSTFLSTAALSAPATTSHKPLSILLKRRRRQSTRAWWGRHHDSAKEEIMRHMKIK